MHYAATAGRVLVPAESPIRPLIDRLHLRVASPEEVWLRWLRPMLAGIVPAEGEVMIGRTIFARFLTDRDADLELRLHTLASPSDATDFATIDANEPSGTGYGTVTLTDANWGTGNPITYPTHQYTAGAGGWTGSVQGYGINTKSAGGAQRLLVIEVDAAGPYTFAENDTYDVSLSITTKDPAD